METRHFATPLFWATTILFHGSIFFQQYPPAKRCFIVEPSSINTQRNTLTLESTLAIYKDTKGQDPGPFNPSRLPPRYLQ